MYCKASVSLLSLFALCSPSLANLSDVTVCNANHIFNTIHSSMRQWGGSLNHNGMSLFLATVPGDTQLYHGTSNPDFIKGMQWLAFEPEHALIFARPRGGRGPGGAPPREGGSHGESNTHENQSDLDETTHNEDYRHLAPPPEYDQRPDHEHHRPSRPHERKPCNGTNDQHECGSRKYRDRGPPPPLPPGHIYKPYPPPSHKERPYNGPRPHWKPDWHGPPRNHDDDDSPGLREPPPGHHDHPDPLPPAHASHKGPSEPIDLRPPPKTWSHRPWRLQQQPLLSPRPDDEEVGYLHTYKPLHDLHLLYIDGLSAGKTSNGTLDTQDLLLLNLTSSDPHGPMGGEMARANGLCELAATIWENRVDGVIRLEGGFEIILCDFEAHLERVGVVTVSRDSDGGRGPMSRWEYTKAVASRYHGIGGGRARVDYEAFVSVFAYAGVEGLWDGEVESDVKMPRLTKVAAGELARIRDDVTSLVLNKDWSEHNGRDWQATADMLVQRYSAPLHHITTTTLFREDKEALKEYLSGLLRPFIDYTVRNATQETARCTAQIVPALPSQPGSLQPLAHRAIHTVGTRICDALFTALSISASTLPHSSYSAVYAEHAVDLVAELIDWLSWTSWKECGVCGDEEVCFIPIWPTGTFEDHARPRCRGAKEVEGRMGYWGMRGGPPRAKPPGAKA